MASQTGRRNMLALFTYYADKSLDIREQPKEMTFRDITVEDADGPFFLNWSTLMPKLQFDGAAPSDRTVQLATGEFKVRPI